MEFITTRFRVLARRALTTAAIALALTVAWTHAGLAGGPGPPYFVDSDGVIRTIGNPPPSTPPNTGGPNSYTTAMKKVSYAYDLSQKKKVFTIMRNGTPWVTVTQTVGGVEVSDPGAANALILDIAGGKKVTGPGKISK